MYLLDKVDERAQRRRHETAVDIIEERTRERLPPWLENRLQRTAVEMPASPTLDQRDDPDPGDGGIDGKVGRSADAVKVVAVDRGSELREVRQRWRCVASRGIS